MLATLSYALLEKVPHNPQSLLLLLLLLYLHSHSAQLFALFANDPLDLLSLVWSSYCCCTVPHVLLTHAVLEALSYALLTNDPLDPQALSLSARTPRARSPPAHSTARSAVPFLIHVLFLPRVWMVGGGECKAVRKFARTHLVITRTPL